MKLQTDALVSQVEIMSKSFLQTGQLVEQNERAVKAAEESAKTAQEALYAGEAPYFGITNIEIIDLLVGRCPTIKITFMNGGKTPAWSFYALAAIFVAYNTDLVSERFWIQPELGNMGDTFIPAGKEKTIHYVKTDFRLTGEQDKALRGEYPQHFFVQGTAHWKTMRGDKRWIEFCGVYYSATGKFGDYYAT